MQSFGNALVEHFADSCIVDAFRPFRIDGPASSAHLVCIELEADVRSVGILERVDGIPVLLGILPSELELKGKQAIPTSCTLTGMTVVHETLPDEILFVSPKESSLGRGCVVGAIPDSRIY